MSAEGTGRIHLDEVGELLAGSSVEQVALQLGVKEDSIMRALQRARKTGDVPPGVELRIRESRKDTAERRFYAAMALRHNGKRD